MQKCCLFFAFLPRLGHCGETQWSVWGHFDALAKAGTTNWRGMLSTVDLLIRLASFVKKLHTIFNVKSSWSLLVSARRSTVLCLPLQLGFPGYGFHNFVLTDIEPPLIMLTIYHDTIRREFLSRINWIYYWRLICTTHEHYNYLQLIKLINIETIHKQ
jgi:hypothetical protein